MRLRSSFSKGRNRADVNSRQQRAVTSTDGMTADFYAFDMKFLGETATRLINEVKSVNRVGV